MNQLEKFNDAALVLFRDLAENTKLKKHYEEREKTIKSELENLMTEYNIKQIDNEFVKITYVGPSTTESIDLKAFEKKEPLEYAELMTDYPKVTNKKGYLRFAVKCWLLKNNLN